MDLIEEIVTILTIVGMTPDYRGQHPQSVHVTECALAGADIATGPPTA